LALIVSSTGTKGDAKKNQELTEARAFVVRKHFVDTIHVEDQKIEPAGAQMVGQGTVADGELVVAGDQDKFLPVEA
jgi:hypothetical protein